jgi:hypothetical protein
MFVLHKYERFQCKKLYLWLHDDQHNSTQLNHKQRKNMTLSIGMSHLFYYYAECCNTECHCAECHCAECRGTLLILNKFLQELFLILNEMSLKCFFQLY